MINSFTGIYSFLSNFYPVEIHHDGIVYPSVEHYYVAQKINRDQYIDNQFWSLFDLKKFIARTKDPVLVKKLGKKFKLRKDWENLKIDFMLIGLRQKFKNKDLADKLNDTGVEQLVEWNRWHDNFWGVCNCGPCGGVGQNHLGKLLMKVREELRNKPKPSLEQFLLGGNDN